MRFSLSASWTALAAERRLRRMIRRFLPGFFLGLGSVMGALAVAKAKLEELGESMVDFAVGDGFAVAG